MDAPEVLQPPEGAGEYRMKVRLTLQDESSSGVAGEVTSDLDVTMSRGGCVAELKAILESQDLLPSGGDDGDLIVEVRFSPTGPALRDDVCIPDSAAMVYLSVRPLSVEPSPPCSAAAPTSAELSQSRPGPQVFPHQGSQLPSLVNPGTASSPPIGLRNMMDQTESVMANPQMMRQIMNSPLMKSIMSNPEMLRTMMESNPQMRELRERNPELNHLLNDPELLRQSMEVMQNPSLMREMITSTDRALSNINAIPGGFNALRKVYQTIQEPMWDAAVGEASVGERSSTTKQYDLRTEQAPSREAIPNPWARPSTSSNANTMSSRSSAFSTPGQAMSSLQRPQIDLRGTEASRQGPGGPFSLNARILPSGRPRVPAASLSSAAPGIHSRAPTLAPASTRSEQAPSIGQHDRSREEPQLEGQSNMVPSSAEEKPSSTAIIPEPSAASSMARQPSISETNFNQSATDPAWSSFPSHSRLRSFGRRPIPHAAHITGVRRSASSPPPKQDQEESEEEPTDSQE